MWTLNGAHYCLTTWPEGRTSDPVLGSQVETNGAPAQRNISRVTINSRFIRVMSEADIQKLEGAENVRGL